MSESVEHYELVKEIRECKQEFLDHLHEDILGVFHLLGDHLIDKYDMLTIEEYMDLCGDRIKKAVRRTKETAREVIEEVPLDEIV